MGNRLIRYATTWNVCEGGMEKCMRKQEEEVPNEIEAGEKMIERKSSFLLFIKRKFKDDGQKIVAAYSRISPEGISE